MNAKKANKKNNISQERLFNMKKFFLFVLALSVCALAADGSVEERVNGLQAQVDRAMSKAGIHFSGEFRSQFLNSALDGDAVGDGKKNESVEYTSVDFDIVARPNTALSARAMFRLHQDWRNFFSDVQNPITTRWLSIDGSLMQGIFKYNFGDYSRKLTPLTLWAPDLEFLYEPEIFAQNRRLAMSEAFVGGNNRALQGANLEFLAELYPILHEVSADVFGARLAAGGNGESGVVSPGVAPPLVANGDYWDNPYDRYLVGVGAGAQIIKGAGLGFNNISIFDQVSSYTFRADKADYSIYGKPVTADSVKAKLSARSTNISAIRANADTRVFMPDDVFNAGLNFEMAFSANKYALGLDMDNPTVDGTDTAYTAVKDTSINGAALNVGLAARVALGDGSVLKLSADYMLNDTNFVNEAAQSPTFVQRSIMNNENPLDGFGLGLMNPFDALYRSVFKYTPSQYFGGPKPYTKNAYINSILPLSKIGGLSPDRFKYPSVFQAALPGGMASTDRVGPVVKFNGSFLDEGVTLGAKFAGLKTMSETEVLDYKEIKTKIVDDNGDPVLDGDGNETFTTGFEPFVASTYKTDFLEAVFGGSVDIAKFAPVVGPSLQISGSWGIYNVKMDTAEVKNNLISIGLNYNFLPRFSFLFGYQLLNADDPIRKGWTETVDDGIPLEFETIGYDLQYNYEFSNLAFGFSYKVADGGTLTAKISMLSGKRKPSDDSKVTKTYKKKMGEVTLEPLVESYTGKSYTAFQPEVYLTVKF